MRMIDLQGLLLRYGLVLILLVLSLRVCGQNSVGSVYSIFGVGELNPTTSVQARAMGNTSIGMSSKYSVNIVNPAANDQTGFYFNHVADIGFYYSGTEHETQELKEISSHRGLSNLSFWFKINDRWSSIVGLNQYSNVGYNINESDVDSFQEGTYHVLYQGKGGLNEFYFSNGVRLIGNLSAGVKLAFIFGNIQRTESVTSSQNANQFYVTNNVNVRDLYAEYSMNYRWERENYDINIGAIYKPKNQLTGSTLSQISTVDLAASTSEVVLDDQEYTEDYGMPKKLGVGFSFSNEKLVLATDVEFNQWSDVSLEGFDDELNDTWRYAVGLEWTPNRFGEEYLARVSYRVGGFTENSYLSFEGIDFSKSGFTAGLELPLRNGSSVNLSYLRQLNGTLENDLIYESTNKVSVNFSLKHRWFQKRKYN